MIESKIIPEFGYSRKSFVIPILLIVVVIVFCLINLISETAGGDVGNNKSDVVFVNALSSKVNLDDVSIASDAINLKYGEKVAVAFFDKASGYYSLHSNKGNVYFTDSNNRVLIKGDVFDIADSYFLNDKHNAMVYFGSNEKLALSKSDLQSEKHPIRTDVNITQDMLSSVNQEDYFRKMQEKLNLVVSAKRIDDSRNGVELTENKAPLSTESSDLITDGTDCLITFAGFNQPKVGYDEKCNPLSSIDKKLQIKTLMSGFPPEFFIQYKAENERSQIYVFTDYTCGYCSKLHRNIDGFLNSGVTVNYIFYPRAVSDPNASSVAKAVIGNMNSAWCSADQVAATDYLYKNRTVPTAECDKSDKKLDSPVRQHYILGMMFDLSGTPLVVADNGEMSYGFSTVTSKLAQLKL